MSNLKRSNHCNKRDETEYAKEDILQDENAHKLQNQIHYLKSGQIDHDTIQVVISNLFYFGEIFITDIFIIQKIISCYTKQFAELKDI